MRQIENKTEIQKDTEKKYWLLYEWAYLPYLSQLRTRWIYIYVRKSDLDANPLEDVSTIDVVWLDVSEILQVCRHFGLHSPPWRIKITAIGAECHIENTTHLTTRYALEAYQETFSSSLQAEYKSKII